MNNENLWSLKGEPGPPVMIIMGVQGQVRCFKENEKFKHVLKDVLNVSIDYLNVVSYV